MALELKQGVMQWLARRLPPVELSESRAKLRADVKLMAENATPESGSTELRYGSYRVIQPLGSGGMSSV